MKQKKRKRKHRVFWFFIKLQIFLMLLIVGALGYYYFGGYAKQISVMQKEAKQLVQASSESTFRAVQTSLVYDVEGKLISTLKGEKDVYYLDIDKVPAYVIEAIISIEDKKFYRHNGIDIKAILRAVRAMIVNGEVTQGASTITQQLARTIFLNMEKTWERKVEEMFIAVDLEKVYSKDKIMEFYLNNIYFANGYYGIQAASKGYFNTEINNLSLSQIAFLCAIPNNPTIYDPVSKIENTIKRRDRILNQMEMDEKISHAVCLEAKGEEIVLDRPVHQKNNYVETYVYYCAARALMKEAGFLFKSEFKNEEDKKDYEKKYNEIYSQCLKSLYTNGYRIYTSIDLKTQDLLQLSVDQSLSSFTEQNEEGIFALQAAAVCIDNRNGFVKAIVGGRSQDLPGYTLNRAYQSFRQPGSVIKPLLVYTPVLERNYTPDTPVMDERMEDGPANSNDSYEGQISLRYAVEKSKNTVAWNLLKEIGAEEGLSYLKKMNFTKLKEEDAQLSAALGGFTTGVSPVEIAAAYETLENSGKYRSPTCIIKIMDSVDNTPVKTEQTETVVYKENAVRMMTDMLVSVIDNGTGKGLALTNMPAAGKTGTTNDNKDGWFAGYTSYYTTSVWVGYDMPRALPGLTGSTYPGDIWRFFMEALHKELPPVQFIPFVR